MRSRTLAALAVLLVSLGTVVLLAHEVTYKGTVVSADAASLNVSVINQKTRKPEVMRFDVDKDTKFLRGEKLVTFTEARIQKNESISVTVNLDDAEDYAQVVRLPAKK
jgi:hypothetical protein